MVHRPDYLFRRVGLSRADGDCCGVAMMTDFWRGFGVGFFVWFTLGAFYAEWLIKRNRK